MPYLSYSMHCCETDNDGEDEECNECGNSHGPPKTQDPIEQELRERCHNARQNSKQLLGCYKGHTIHRSSTLDEWYYHFPSDLDSQNDRKDRNKTQVATKGLSITPENGIHWPLIRVNQLWLWTIGESMCYSILVRSHWLTERMNLEWLITASPHPLDDKKNTLVEGILDHLSKQREDGGSRSQPGSTFEMSELIVEYCIGSYERRPNSSRQTLGSQLLSIRQMFSNSINIIVRKSVPQPRHSRHS